jgi:hypothetical protein
MSPRLNNAAAFLFSFWFFSGRRILLMNLNGSQPTLSHPDSNVWQADNLAQRVVNIWARYVTTDALTPTFWPVFEKASSYRKLKQWNDRHRRRFGSLDEASAAEEESARQAFAEEYKRADDAFLKGSSNDGTV